MKQIQLGLRYSHVAACQYGRRAGMRGSVIDGAPSERLQAGELTRLSRRTSLHVHWDVFRLAYLSTFGAF